MSAEQDDYRRRAGLATAWQQDVEPGDGPGLFAVTEPDGHRWVTNVTRLAGNPSEPGTRLIGAAGWLLLILGGGVLAVSYAGQFTYIYAARHQVLASNIEAGMFDVGMIIFALLGLGLAFARKPSRTERMLVVACSLGSAAMGYAAADVASPRSVAALVAPPLFLAVVVDRVIAVVRRHRLGDDETSPWAPLGRVAWWLLRAVGVVLLYGLRLVLDPHHTVPGLRRVVLLAAPLPEPPARHRALPDPPADVRDSDAPSPDNSAPGTKKARLLELYRAHPGRGDRKRLAAIAAELAPQAGLQAGTARTYLLAEVKGLEG